MITSYYAQILHTSHSLSHSIWWNIYLGTFLTYFYYYHLLDSAMIERIGWVRWPEVGLPGRESRCLQVLSTPPATARDPGIERLAIDSFPTTAVSNWYVYLKLLTIDVLPLKINNTQMEAFGTTPVFFTVCVCEQETEDDSIFSVSLWKSHASWNQTISFSYHCLPTSTICQRIVQGRNQIAKQKPLLHQMRAMDGWNWRCVIFFLAKQRLFWSV